MGEIINYDKWKLRTPDDDLKVYCHCDHCRDEIYFGETYYRIEGDDIHEECFYEYCIHSFSPIHRVAGEENE